MKYVYTAVFTPMEDNSGYYARVPDLLGCITTGKDLPDAIDQIKDAMSVRLVVAEDEGMEDASYGTEKRSRPEEKKSLLLAEIYAGEAIVIRHKNVDGGRSDKMYDRPTKRRKSLSDAYHVEREQN